MLGLALELPIFLARCGYRIRRQLSRGAYSVAAEY
jgi:hypothetical protein